MIGAIGTITFCTAKTSKGRKADENEYRSGKLDSNVWSLAYPTQPNSFLFDAFRRIERPNILTTVQLCL